MEIVIIEGHELDGLLAGLERRDAVYALRVWPQGDGTVKIKINGGVWTPRIGRADH